MTRPLDRLPPRRALGDANGRKPPERMSEYFDFERWPEKADQKVTRLELLVFLDRAVKGVRETWYTRLWRFIKAPLGSGPVTAVPEVKDE